MSSISRSTSCFVILLVFLAACNNVSATQKDVQAEKGDNVMLPCDIDGAKCGDLHSIKWYRGSARIYVFSHMPNIARSEGSGTSRMEVKYVPGSSESQLLIKHLELVDEAVYKCEITYMEVRENCDVVQFVNLTTLVRPSEVRVFDSKGNTFEDGSTLGPFNERTEIDLTCEATGGKPIPIVAWYNKTDKKMNAEYTSEPDTAAGHGVGTGRARLQVTLSRGDLKGRYECRIENDALHKPITIGIDVDVNVRPTKLELSGVESHVVKGTNVLLQCNVHGARPAANVTWYNGTEPINGEITGTSAALDDGTFETQSRLLFTATRFENGKSISCEADNAVMRDEVEPSLHQTIKLEVLYPPIVSISPENITVNESADTLIICNYEANPASLNSTIWTRNGIIINVSDKDHYEGGNNEHTALLIKNVTRHDMGEYSCTLSNSVGSQESENVAYLNVYFKPLVELIMKPSSIIIENDRTNVTLTCLVVSGNPDTLLSVRWYLGSELLKELPDCNNTASFNPMCDSVDPSRMLLQYVEQQFAGNHSCEGLNEAGWGPRSAENELIVYYPPSSAILTFEPKNVVKKSFVKLSCSVENPGRPERTQYRWLRGTHLVPDITTSEWVISPVTLETESNFTCIAFNEGGESEPDTVFIEVYVPPTFISNMHPYQGILYNSKNISISCRVECSPLCNITWLKNFRTIDIGNTDLYYVQETIMPADSKTNDFESIHSTLIWNMTAWPNEQLDRITDNANYTCESTTNNVNGAPGVKSTTFIAVEYPPENITLSHLVINVIENTVPNVVCECSAKARPEPTYHWYREGISDIISNGDKLRIETPVLKRDAGNYICEPYNRHGNTTKATYLNVLYKPECQISQTTIDGASVLVCSVKANPEEVDFVWKIKDDNDTVDPDSVESKGLQSVLTLDSSVEEFRTYLCYANNSVGISFPCERDVSGAVAWWKRLSDDELLIIVAVIVVLILCVIIICVIIIIVCKRKRASDKYNNPVELEEREKPEGQSQSEHQNTQTAHKWPLKPGVLVHVNRMHSLSMGRLTNISLSGLNINNGPKESTYTNCENTPKITPSTSKFGKVQTRRVKSMGCLIKPDEFNQHSRTQRLKQIFIKGFGGTLDNSFPEGVFRGSSGVVTFKKLPTPSPSEGMGTASRKRKKPGQGPSQSNTADKAGLNPDNPSEVLTDPDRGFYENLPFHGMQNPPNKPISVIAPLMKQASVKSSEQNKFPNQLTNSTISTHYNNTPFHSPNKNHVSTDKITEIHRHPFSTPFNPHQNLSLHKNASLLQPKQFLSKSNPFNFISPDNSTNENVNRIQLNHCRPNQQRNYPNSSFCFTSHRDSIRQNVNNTKKFYSLVPQKNKILYQPQFYSVRTCKRHHKRAAIFSVRENILKSMSDEDLKKLSSLTDKLQPPLLPRKSTNFNGLQNAQLHKISIGSTSSKIDENLKDNDENLYENLTDSIQIFEQSSDLNLINQPKPAPRKKSILNDQPNHLYENIPMPLRTTVQQKIDNNTSTSDSVVQNEQIKSDFKPIQACNPIKNIYQSGNDISRPKCKTPRTLSSTVTKAISHFETPISSKFSNFSKNQVHPKTSDLKFPIPVKAVPHTNLPFISETHPKPFKDKITSVMTPDNINNSNEKNQFYTLTPNFKHLTAATDQQCLNQFSNYSTMPPNRHLKLLPRTLFREQPQLNKSKSFSAKPKQKKHFQIPLQKCHSFKFQPTESYFQPIKSHINEDLTENGHLKNNFSENRFNVSGYFNENKPYFQKPSIENMHDIQLQLRNPIRMNLTGEKRKGPLLYVKNDVISREHFHENNDFVKLQYPQPLYGQNTTNFSPNGVVYADLTISDLKNKRLTSLSNDKISNQALDDRQNNQMKKNSKHKTEYATLKFNEIGQEIDV